MQYKEEIKNWGRKTPQPIIKHKEKRTIKFHKNQLATKLRNLGIHSL